MTLKTALLFVLLATPAIAQGRADPTTSNVGDPSGAIRSLSNSSEGRSDGKQTTQVPAGSTSDGQPHGAPAGTSAPTK